MREWRRGKGLRVTISEIEDPLPDRQCRSGLIRKADFIVAAGSAGGRREFCTWTIDHHGLGRGGKITSMYIGNT
ncbi:hypothetical protein D9M68_902630 [compost metagenome]